MGIGEAWRSPRRRGKSTSHTGRDRCGAERFSLVPSADITCLFDHLIGTLLEMERNVEAERLGGLEVDDQIELDWSLDGKLTRLRALEDTIGIGRRPLKIIELVVAV